MTESLQRSWEVTRKHLNAALNLLPSECQRPVQDGPVARYEDWLSHNELELAFDELESIGMENDCPSEFWQELLYAAQNMGLEKHSARCKRKVEHY